MSEAVRYTFRTELAGLLPRLRQTIPFPCDPVKVYSGAFTPQVAKWFVDRVPTSMHHHNIAYRNLLRATARQQVIHFTLQDPRTMDDWADPAQPFWLHMEDCPVCPSSVLSPFMLDEAVRKDPKLTAWYAKAEAMDTEIRHFHNKIYEVSPLFSSKADIARAWPEVASAVPSLLAGMRTAPHRDTGRIEAIRGRLNLRLSAADSVRLVELLAASVMLPADLKPAAWIGLNKKGIT